MWRRVQKTGERHQKSENWEQQPEIVGSCLKAAERSWQAFRTAERNKWLLHIALGHLVLARARFYPEFLGMAKLEHRTSSVQNRRGHGERQTENDEASEPSRSIPVGEEIEAAVDGLRRAGDMTQLPRGLLTRALFRHVQGNEEGCRADLEEAERIAERGPMRLHLADIHLHRARLFGDLDALEKAAELIEETGYHRRDEELEDARRMRNEEGESPNEE